ncbi:PAQR family membrane homeostasis protein TrhA [Gilvimarinus sp. F26214L]|uniref:PAQR family membrane homeostasis protein TrhA n=1 Tax=Gilvimarinus sp. DZF01 TaxID=3461371 RepID=UPI004045CAC2
MMIDWGTRLRVMYYGERFNSISHLVGAALALVGFGALLTVSIQSGDAGTIVSFSIFGLTLVLLYTMSTLYHSFHPHRIKSIFRKLDHVTIYLLIAGTYTPYMVVALGNDVGYRMLGIVWGLAVAGLLLDVLNPNRVELLQLAVYLFMGWICVFEFPTLQASLPTQGLIWLTVGGVAYTVGIVFYVMDGLQFLKHSHGIWHIFVLVGSVSHFISIIGFVR